MTGLQLKNFFRETLTPLRQISQEYSVLDAIVDFITASITSGIPTWTNVQTFNTNGTGAGAYATYSDINGALRFWKTKTDGNTNNLPPTDPLITENTHWKEVSPSSGSAIKEWAPGIYGSGLVIVYFDISGTGAEPALYLLTEAGRPFNSINFATELAANKWKRMSGSGSGLAIAATYEDITELIAEQGVQVQDAWYMVQDASDDPTVDSDWAIYQYLGTTDGDVGDYLKIWEKESMDLVINDASESIKGIIQIASTAETNAGVIDTKAVTPSKMKMFADSNYASLSANQSIAGIKTFTTLRLLDNGGAGPQFVEFSTPNNTADRIIQIPATSNTTNMLVGTGGGANRIAYTTANAYVLTFSSNFTYNGSTLTSVPSATVEGLNLGSLAGNPSAPNDGGIWRNSTAEAVGVRLAATTYYMQHMTLTDAVVNRLPFIASTSGRLSSSANLTFNGTVLTSRFQGTSTATNAGVNVGGVGAFPSTAVNADISYHSTVNEFILGINGIQAYAVHMAASSTTSAANRIPFLLANDRSRLSTDSTLTYASGILDATNVRVGSTNSYSFLSRSQITSPTNGQIRLINNTNTNFDLLIFGLSTNLFVALKRNSATLEVRLADDSAYAGLTSGSLSVIGNVSLGSASFSGTDRSIAAVSSSTNCNVVISPQAAGKTIFRYDGAGSYVVLGTSTDTGAQRNITVDGSSGDVSLGLLSKGNGGINLSTGAGTGYVQLISQSKVYRFGDVANLGASLELPVAFTAVDMTMTNSHFVVVVDSTLANRIITLPIASTCAGRLYVIVKADSSLNSVQLAAAVGDTIDGSPTRTMGLQWNVTLLISDGVNNYVRISTK